MDTLDPRLQPTIRSWSEDWQVACEERAAIIEYEGGYSRSAAEFRAVIEIAELKRTQDRQQACQA